MSIAQLTQASITLPSIGMNGASFFLPEGLWIRLQGHDLQSELAVHYVRLTRGSNYADFTRDYQAVNV